MPSTVQVKRVCRASTLTGMVGYNRKDPDEDTIIIIIIIIIN
jgi:hypothetical protein